MNNLTRFAWRPVLLAFLGAALGAASAAHQSPPGAAERPRVAIRAIAATPSVAKQAKDEGSADALLQIEQGADPQLMDALAGTGRFDTLLGSVAQQVVAKSHRPVLVVPSPRE